MFVLSVRLISIYLSCLQKEQERNITDGNVSFHLKLQETGLVLQWQQKQTLQIGSSLEYPDSNDL